MRDITYRISRVILFFISAGFFVFAVVPGYTLPQDALNSPLPKAQEAASATKEKLPSLPGVKQTPSVEEKFFVKKIEVVGNTFIPISDLAPFLSPYEGHEVDLQTLKKVAGQITELYLQKGYLLARAYVPPQRIEKGVAKIFVIEGRIGEIKIEGNQAYSSDFIKYYLTPVIQKNILQYADFEKALLLLNEFPDLHVQSYLQPGIQPGATDVILKISDKTPIHGQIEYNNFGSPFAGRNHAGLEFWHGNLTGRGDLLALRGTFPWGPSQNPFISADYSIPVSPSGTKFIASYSNADIKLGEELQVLDIRGIASIYGVGFTQPLIRTTAESANFSSSFYFKNVQNYIFGGILSSRDKLRELVFGYDHQWSTSSVRHFLQVSATQGLGTLFGGMGKNDPFASRAGADNTFSKFNGDFVSVLKVFSDDFVLFRGQAQYALGPLAVAEQYSVGGSDTVRGYQQSEVLGDSGWVLSAEFRVPLNGRNAKNSVQGAFFFDTGFTSLRNAQPGETPQRHLTGAGVGVRANLGSSTSLRVDLGFPVDPKKNANRENPVFYGQFVTQF